MAEPTANALPWPNQGSHENSTASETTPGGEQPVRWVVIRANVDPGEAMVLKSRLESEGIPTLVQQEAVGTVLGLTVGPLGSAKVLVPEPLAEQALAILAETFEGDTDEEGETED
jgi:hypothetical protein